MAQNAKAEKHAAIVRGMTANLKRLAECDLTAQIVEDYSAAYGAQGSGPIPANADLVFQVELVDYKPATARRRT